MKAWPVRGETYWCPGLNVPTVGPECGGGGAFKLNLSDPGDPRPAFERDLGRLLEGYRYEAGSEAGFGELRGYSVVLLNKVPYMDLMYEVVADGRIIGRLYWDPLLDHWRLRFSLAGLLRVWDHDPLPTLTFNGSLKALERERFLRAPSKLPVGRQVAFKDPTGTPIGVGYVDSDGFRVKVHTIYWRSVEPYASKSPSNWEDAVKANEYYLYYHSSRAAAFINVMAAKVRKPVIVSYSGGKDSLAALSLTLEAGVKPAILFNDTGLELPETRMSVERIAEGFGLELIVADAGDSFWRTVERVGPPGRDYRWCCKVTKLAPLSRVLQERYPEGALNIVGQRAYESLDRARSLRVWRNRWLPHILNIAPIQYWTQLLVWLYIWDRGLPYNPLYEEGYDRIGCYMCPAAYTAEYRHVAETHPRLWERWESVLYRWAERIGLDGEAAEHWVRKGLWRWLTPAAQKERLARRVGVVLGDWRSTYSRWLEPRLERFEAGDGGAAVFAGDFPLNGLRDQYTVLGAFRLARDDGEVTLEGPSGVRLRYNGREFKVEGAKSILARELLLDSVKLAYRWANCVGCRSCEASCPRGAIKVVEVDGVYRPRVNAEKCIHCKLCLDNCPLSDVVVEKIYAAQALDYPTAWRRWGRRSKESVIERFLKLKGYTIQEGAETPGTEASVIPSGFLGDRSL